MKSNLNIWRWFFAIAALEAGAAFVVLLSVQHEAGGYSASRLVLLLLLGACLVVCAFSAIRVPRRLAEPGIQRYAGPLALAALVVATVLFLLRYSEPERLLPYFQRLAPMLWFLLLVSAEGSIACLVAGSGLHPEAIREAGSWRIGAVTFAILLLAYAFVGITRIGLTPDSAYWGEPGVPILGWQFGVALVCGAAALLAGLKQWRVARVDLIIGVSLWLIAVLLWLSVPNDVLKNSFYAPINPPSNQPFPNSDAGYYDSMAHSLLIGYPYQGEIPTRPLYIALLAGLHALLGEQYGRIIVGQTLLLALLPVVLYLLGKRLHSRTAGVVMALFSICREWNSLLVSSQTRVSNSKMLLVDIPTLLLELLACLFVVRWIQRKGRMDALVAGGLLGLLLLLRTQTLLLLPIAVTLGILAYGVRSRAWILPAAVFVLGVVAGLAPWLLHNYLRSGQLTLDAPFEYQVIASQYKYTGNLDLNAADLQGKSLTGILLEFAIKDPKFVAGFICSHFSATLIDSLLILPLQARYDGLFAPLNLYWMNWPENLDAANAAILIPYLAVIALGIASCWKRGHWAGLVPLGCAFGYALANGIGRFSGWRYDLPADWVGYFYLAIGVAELFSVLAGLFGASVSIIPGSPTSGAPAVLQWRRVGVIAAAFLILGALPWLAEKWSPPRYVGQDLPTLVRELVSAPNVQEFEIDRGQVETFAAQPLSTLQIGRVLYPRYFPRNTGLPSSHPWPAYAVRDFPRVGFLLLNQSRHDALIALKQVGDGFDQGADAIILGCQQKDYIDARLVFFPSSGAAFLGTPLSEPCR